MKKLILGTITTIALITGSAAIAQSEETFDSPMFQMFSQYHDLTDEQQALAVDLFDSGKQLGAAVRSAKPQIESYLADIVEKDNIDVEQIMLEYKAWQQGVDQKFEAALYAAAALHSDLSVEQRKNILATIKKMKSRKR